MNIHRLEEELRVTICVFYLVLRGLETIFEEKTISRVVKVQLLRDFYNSIDFEMCSLNCGSGHEQQLLEDFHHVARLFSTLKPADRTTIKEITQEMGLGMIELLTRDVTTKDDYNFYCHTVSGLVWIGLSRLMFMSGLQGSTSKESEERANHVGLFLQKSIRLRDFLEDLDQARVNEALGELGEKNIVWPKDVWGRHVGHLEDLTQPQNEAQALACLNEMVVDAITHLPHCLAFLESVQNEQAFVFCAVPLVTALESISMYYNNSQIFRGAVARTSRGQSRNSNPVMPSKGRVAELSLKASSMQAVFTIVEDAMHALSRRISENDPCEALMKDQISATRGQVERIRTSSMAAADIVVDMDVCKCNAREAAERVECSRYGIPALLVLFFAFLLVTSMVFTGPHLKSSSALRFGVAIGSLLIWLTWHFFCAKRLFTPPRLGSLSESRRFKQEV